MQTNWKPAFFYSFKDKWWRHLHVFEPLYRSHLAEKLFKKTKLKRPAFSLLVGAWSTSCSKITPKYVILTGAWPIHPSGSDWAGPARKTKNYSVEQQMVLDGWRITKQRITMQMLYFVFFLVIGWRDYLPVAFCTCEQNVTYFACAYAIRQTPSPWYVYPIPVYWPGLPSFLVPEWHRGRVPHTFPH